MKYLKFMAIGLALIFVFSTSFTKKKVLYPPVCKFSVSSIIDQGTGYIHFHGAEITGKTEGVDYNCLFNPSQICTIEADCRAVLQWSEDEFYIGGWYNTTAGQYQ